MDDNDFALVEYGMLVFGVFSLVFIIYLAIGGDLGYLLSKLSSFAK